MVINIIIFMLTNLQISNIYRGSTPVNKVMLNGAVVWPIRPVFTFETKETSVITLTAITDNDAIVSDYNNNTISHVVELGDFPTGGYEGSNTPGINNSSMTITQEDLGIHNYFGITTAINFDGTVIAGVGGLNELEADGIPRGRVRVYKANYDDNDYVQLGSYISIHENFNAPERYPEWDDTQNKYTYTCDLNSFRRYGSGDTMLPGYSNLQNNYEVYSGYAPKDIRFGIHFDTTIRLDDSGTRIAISAPWAAWAAADGTISRKAQGLVRVFDYNSVNDSWEQVGNDIWGERELAILGMNLQMAGSGTRILVSHQKQRENSNIFDFFQRVYDYDQSSNQWIQKGKDLITTETYQEETNDYVSSDIAPRRAPYFSFARELPREPAFTILQLAGNGESIYYSPDVELRFDESRDDWVVVGPIYLGWRPEGLGPEEEWSDHYPHIFIMDRSGKAYATHFAETGYYCACPKSYYRIYSFFWDTAAIYIKTDDNAGKVYSDRNAYAEFDNASHILCDAKITPLYGVTMTTLTDRWDPTGWWDSGMYALRPRMLYTHEDTAAPRRLPIEWGIFDQWGGQISPNDIPRYQDSYSFYDDGARRDIWSPGGRTGRTDGRGTADSVSLEIYYSDDDWKDLGENDFNYKHVIHYPLQGTTNGCSVQISGDGTTVIAGEATFERIHIYKRKPVDDRITRISSNGPSGSTENNKSYNISGENNRAIAVEHNLVDTPIIAYFQVYHARAFTGGRYSTTISSNYRYHARIILEKIINTTDGDINISVECNNTTKTLKVSPGESSGQGLTFTVQEPASLPAGSVVKKDLVITNLDAGVETREEITFKTNNVFYIYSYDKYIISVGGIAAGSANLTRTINLYSVSHVDVVNNADRPFTLKGNALVAQYEPTDSALKAVYFGDQQLESLTIRNHKEFTVMQTDKTGTRSVIYERPDWLTTVQTPLFYTIHGSGVNYTYIT